MSAIFIRNRTLHNWFTANRRKFEFLAIAGLCLVLNACMLKGGAQEINPGMKALLSPRQLSFPGTAVGTTTAPQTVMLTNNGNGSMTIVSITLSGDFAQTNNCGASLAAGLTCTITVTFTPTATGAESGQILISDNAIGSPQAITLAGATTQEEEAAAPKSAPAHPRRRLRSTSHLNSATSTRPPESMWCSSRTAAATASTISMFPHTAPQRTKLSTTISSPTWETT